ncbi:MAG TPA: hypothetical protein VFS20_01865 [Longimicrobium sp.]|nr:hypothetical protein [Longimicrobium sp.]
MTIRGPKPLHLLAAALFFCAAPAASAQGGRLYGMIDADFLGHDIAFSVELGRTHAVRFYNWGRHLEEVEGMAIDRQGEMYLFDETGVVKKVRLRTPDAQPDSVAAARYEVTSASVRPSDGMIELFDARRGQIVTFNPRTDAYVTPTTRRPRTRAPEFSGLARSGTQLYGSAVARDSLHLHACTDQECRPACTAALGLAGDVQAIDGYTGTMLILARTSLTETNQIVLHVESLDPRTCARRQLFAVTLDRERIRSFLKPSIDLDDVMRRARRANRSPEIEAIVFQP